MILAIFTILNLVVPALASLCCTPERITAKIQVHTYINRQFYSGQGIFYADYKLGMVVNYVKADFLEGQSISYYNLYTGDSFLILNNTCIKNHLDIPFLQKLKKLNCIPDDTPIDSTFSVGGPSEGLELIELVHPIKNGKIHTFLTKHHCYPVGSRTVLTNMKTQGVKVITDTDVTIGSLKFSIDDPSVFTVPDICNKN